MKRGKLVCFLAVVLACVFAFACGCKKDTPLTDGETDSEITVSLDRASMLLSEGEERTLFATVTGTTDAPTWISSDESVATVGGGTVRGIKRGNAVITAKIGEAEATCEVTVTGDSYYPAITLSKKEASIFRGGSLSVEARVTHRNETVDDAVINWSSDDTDIATVNNGVITGVGTGMARIIAKCEYMDETLEESVLITVTSPLAFTINEYGVELYMRALNDGEKEEQALTTTALYENVPIDGTTTWESLDTQVATVDEGGTVTAVKSGTTEIVASFTAENSEKSKARVTVTVKKSEKTSDKKLGDIDMSKTFVSALTDLDSGLSGYSGSIKVAQGIVSVNATVESGNISFDTSAFEYGESTLKFELEDSILNIDALLVTKILTTPDDVLKIVEYAGGIDPETQAYDGYFVLGDNIDMGGESKKFTTYTEPVITERVSTRGFQGVFDGRGKTIANGYIASSGGIFGTVGANGTVKNLSVVNAVFDPNANGAGVIAQKFFGTMENVFLSATLIGGKADCAALFYVSTRGLVKDVVVEFTNKSTRKDFKNALFFRSLPSAGLVVNNLYGVSDLLNEDGDVYYRIGSWQNLNVAGGGVHVYKFTDANKEFNGLNAPCWNNANTVPTFFGVGEYTEQHLRENESGTYDEVVSYMRHAMAGESVSATGKTFEGYKYDSAQSETSGVLSNAPLELKLYYNLIYTVETDKTSVELGLSENTTATVAATVKTVLGNVSGAQVSWSSSSAAVATAENGTITAAGIGLATVTASYETRHGETVRAEITVTVGTIVDGSEFDLGDIDLSDGTNEINLAAVGKANYSGSVTVVGGSFNKSGTATDGKVNIDFTGMESGAQTVNVFVGDTLITDVKILAATMIINNMDDLNGMIKTGGISEDKLNYYGYFILGQSFDANGATYTPTAAFGIPDKNGNVAAGVGLVVGSSSTGGFQGTFDGRGHTISNLAMINDPIFGNIGAKGKVMNVCFKDAIVRIYGNAYHRGFLASKIYGGTIENVNIICSVDDRNTSNANVKITAGGLLVGITQGNSTKIKDVVVDYYVTSLHAETVFVLVNWNQGGKPTSSFENVYLISKSDRAISAIFNATGNADMAEISKGITQYKSSDDKTFTGLDSNYWNTTGDIPKFKTAV